VPIEYKRNHALFSGIASVDEAEGLVEWLLKKATAAKVDLGACTHLHSANLQVLIAAKSHITVWPSDANLRAWLETVLKLD
jgi:hypothetical protein